MSLQLNRGLLEIAAISEFNSETKLIFYQKVFFLVSLYQNVRCFSSDLNFQDSA